MAKLIIHPGSPKTGTTSIQHYLNLNKKTIENRSLKTKVLKPSDFRGHPILRSFATFYRSETNNLAAKVIQDYFRHMDDEYDYVIVSEETFCHDFMPSRKFGNGGIDRSEKTIRIIEEIPISEKKVVLTIRNQVDFLISTYTHFVHRHRETRSFDKWIKSEVDFGRLSWLSAIEKFENAFGAENVSVIPFEIVKSKNMTSYVKTVFNEFEILDSKINLNINEVRNPSPSKAALMFCRGFNLLPRSRAESVAVNNALIKRFPTNRFGKLKPKKDLILKVYENYSGENYELANRKFPQHMTGFI